MSPRIPSITRGFVRPLNEVRTHFWFCLCCNLFTSKPERLLEQKLLNSALLAASKCWVLKVVE